MNAVIKPTPMLLAVLALLYEAPMHPYQLHRMLLERGKELIADVKPGSIYHAVQRLEKHGLAESVETAKEGRRPERTTYRITDAGRTACLEWTQTMLARPKTDYPQFLAGLATAAVLDPEVVANALTRRAEDLDGELSRYRDELRQYSPVLPRVVLIEAEYLVAVRTAELDWIRGIVQELRSGALHWDEQMLRQISQQEAGMA